MIIGPCDFLGCKSSLCKHGWVLVDCPECVRLYRDRHVRRFNRWREAQRRARRKVRRNG
jgi:hypothetical protein